MARNPMHSSKSCEWYTPPELIERVTFVLGGRIDLDPASSCAANEIVQANRYITEEQDGLNQDWDCDTLFLNPPGRSTDDSCTRGYYKYFWNKLVTEFLHEHIRAGAIYLCYSLEQLQTLQVATHSPPLAWAVCVLRGRTKFIGGSEAPTHGNAVVLLTEKKDMLQRFVTSFQAVGSVSIGPRMLGLMTSIIGEGA